MKNLIALLTITIIGTFASCKKENVAPVSSQPADNKITVEYKIHANSGKFDFVYTTVDNNGNVIDQSGTSAKYDFSTSFKIEKNNTLHLKARNTNPSSDEVTVDIYINGQLKSSGIANSASKWAEAEFEIE